MDLLLVTDGDISPFVYIQDFDRFMFHKTKITFAKAVCSVLVVKMCQQNIKKFVCIISKTRKRNS